MPRPLNFHKGFGETLPLLSRPKDESLGEADNHDLLDDGDGQRHLGLFSTSMLLTNRMVGATIFLVPASIAQDVGSVGAALSLWLVGVLLAFCGLLVWLELGCLRPRSGGEMSYLQAAYPRPYLLTTTIFASYVVFGFIGLLSPVVAENFLLAIDLTPGEWSTRFLSVGVMGLVAAIHITSRVWSVRIMNTLGMVKIVGLVVIISLGIAALFGQVSEVPDPLANFRHPFAGSSSNFSDYVVAVFKILVAFQGWNNASYVLDEIKQPRSTLKQAGVLGVGCVGILYFFTNIAYFVVASPEEISRSGVQLVALTFGKTFGSGAVRLAAALIALSTCGCLMAVSFTASRLVQILVKEGILPLSSSFGAGPKSDISSRTFMVVFGSSVVAILFIPFGDAYDIFTSVSQYYAAIISFPVVGSLFILRRQIQPTNNNIRIGSVIPLLFLAGQTCLLLAPFMFPQAEGGNVSSAWLALVMVVCSLVVGGEYWCIWLAYQQGKCDFNWDQVLGACEWHPGYVVA
ncbi:amino acid transporter [Penicillium alfredii]|uniref:Amino acid transporter n=1 Tax=Penicillium alfredii TaxID=1506179 RepID=A0A9W9ER43_9EURO|nr:amino acid transporter [Penicillium alfredii]KAJ5086467.1 amino acid transporter [Penicillium alfredii]